MTISSSKNRSHPHVKVLLLLSQVVVLGWVLLLWEHVAVHAFPVVVTTTRKFNTMIRNVDQQQQQQQQRQQQRRETFHGIAITPPSNTKLIKATMNMDIADDDTTPNSYELDIVVMGVGDLRIDDHEGLYNALSLSKSNQRQRRILPIILWNDEMIRRTPGMISHTIDTCHILSYALRDLQQSLFQNVSSNLQLHYMYTHQNNMYESLCDIVTKVGKSYNDVGHHISNIRIHVCNLGDADNSMKYNPYGTMLCTNNQDDAKMMMEIIPWCPHLRNEPWIDVVTNIPDTYPEYEKKYIKTTSSTLFDNNNNQNIPSPPFDIFPSSNLPHADMISSAVLPEYTTIPDGNAIYETVRNVLRKMDKLWDEHRFAAEQNTGLYGTHYGGLPYQSIQGSLVRKALHSYFDDYKENDQEYMIKELSIRSNPSSLEHSSMKWQLNNYHDDNTNIQSNQWMKSEAMIRYLSIPLLLGTISSRRVWYEAQKYHNKKGMLLLSPWISSLSPLQEFVEGNEWHRLFAAKNIRTQPSYCRSNTTTTSTGTTSYHYWRYHGYLCRYAYTPLVNDTNNQVNTNHKNGILLVHGFGASGTQYNKVIQEISRIQQEQGESKSSSLLQGGLAPDLIGFGHSVKPAISYTGYMWCSQMLEFLKEIAMPHYQWNCYITGGNSIGGFTALSLAASDMAKSSHDDNTLIVSSSGSPGTQRCLGLILMNSAGPVLTKEEIELQQQQQQQQTKSSLSVAQMTSLGLLKPCSPPPRWFARAFGNVLLGYLQPRIQSICQNLYPINPTAVDEELCVNNILRDSCDIGAINVMMAGAKLPQPRTANELLQADFGGASIPSSSTSSLLLSNNNGIMTNGDDSATKMMISESAFTGPVLIAQGVLDPLNNSTDRMNRFVSLRNDITGSPLQAGHCPHDELPDQMAQSIVTWWRNMKSISSSSSSVANAEDTVTATTSSL